MKKNTKLSIQRQTLKSLATDVLDAIAGGRIPTTGEPTEQTHRCSRVTSCDYRCTNGLC